MADLHPTTHLQAAAWVPDDDPERPWDEAAALAADWIWERAPMRTTVSSRRRTTAAS